MEIKFRDYAEKFIFARMLPTYMFPNYLFIYFFVFSTFSYSQDKLFPEHCLANYNVNDSKLLKGIKDDFYNAKFLETPEESYNLAINTLEKAKINNDIELQIYCYRLLAIIGHNENKLIEALNYITEAYRVVEEYGMKNEIYAISIMSDYAVYLKMASRYDEALKLYHEISKLMDTSCPNPNIERFTNYNNIAAIYIVKEDYDNALLAYKKAHREAKQLNNKLWLSSSLNDLGFFYYNNGKGDLKKALHYFNKAKKELNLELKPHKIFEANIEENIGHIKIENKEYKKAYSCYNKASNIYRLNNHLTSAGKLDVKKYNCLLLLEDYKNLEKLDDSLSVFFGSKINQETDVNSYELYLKLKLHYLKQVNKLEDYVYVSTKYQESLKYKEKYQDTLNKNVFNSYVNLIQNSHKKKIKLERRIASLKQKELKQKQHYLYAVLFLFLIIILVLFLLFKVRNSRIKQENVITKLVLENTTLEKKILNQKLEAKNKDIVSIITDKKIRTNFLKLLLERMELFANKNNEDKSSGLLSIINDVKAQITLENRLSVLESDINNVNTNFEAIIMERYPSLSKTEREVCAFIKLNLSIKETAIIRGVSQDSIKMARSRIRKKLKLDSKEELDKYIQSI